MGIIQRVYHLERGRMDIRTQRQREFAGAFINRASGRLFNQDMGGILYLCPRFGKCRVGVFILESMPADAKILICYPNVEIEKAWKEEFDKMEYDYSNVTFTTHLSMKKHSKEKWDLVIIDEIHLLSEAQLLVAADFKVILGLTGTMSTWTERTLGKRLGLNVLATYDLETAIKEGVITDYNIEVVSCSLDDRELQTYKNRKSTEKKEMKRLTTMLRRIEEAAEISGRFANTKFIKLARMRIVQNSLAKMKMTRKILAENKDQRILVFCGVTAIADQIGCPVYHSKAGEKEVFRKFAEGEGNHLAVVKIGNTGVTYKPLNRVVVNYFDSNAENLAQKILRCMAMEYNTPDKKALITIICSDEPVERGWLKKALDFFEPSKIKYL